MPGIIPEMVTFITLTELREVLELALVAHGVAPLNGVDRHRYYLRQDVRPLRQDVRPKLSIRQMGSFGFYAKILPTISLQGSSL